jgi:hypothetical protein
VAWEEGRSMGFEDAIAYALEKAADNGAVRRLNS